MTKKSTAIKGNLKGGRRSYQARRAAILGGACVFFVALLVVSTTLQNNKVSAEQVEVSLNGDAVGLKGGTTTTNNQEDDTRHLLSSSSSLQSFPTLKYGTAWKEDRTADLVYMAIMAGFRHVDTACQPRHYQENLVGQGLWRAATELGLSREQVWIQTKFTSPDGQDVETTPYDRNAPLDQQVRQSFQVSLKNLQVEYVDSLIMHGPENSWEANLQVWRAMEALVDDGRAKQIGISNFYQADAVEYLYNQARIKPAVVQNRFYADSDYDVEIRQFCIERGMEYQSFWTLGANYHALHDEQWKSMASQKGLTPETLMYAFCMAIGITPLDGSTNQEHMVQDVQLLSRVQAGEKILSQDEIELCSELLGIGEEEEGDWGGDDEEEEREEAEEEPEEY